MLVGRSLVQLILDVVKDLVDSLPGRVGKGRLSQRTPQVGDRLQRADLETGVELPNCLVTGHIVDRAALLATDVEHVATTPRAASLARRRISNPVTMHVIPAKTIAMAAIMNGKVEVNRREKTCHAYSGATSTQENTRFI